MRLPCPCYSTAMAASGIWTLPAAKKRLWRPPGRSTDSAVLHGITVSPANRIRNAGSSAPKAPACATTRPHCRQHKHADFGAVTLTRRQYQKHQRQANNKYRLQRKDDGGYLQFTRDFHDVPLFTQYTSSV